ncbi:putative flagellar basal body protein [Paratrimastix pyriformis]|uniref:Cilia- and flagella-associated protein 300 n=1 Tax=Paratrimastix pyriformis TaxID=342808 RepID=A0ABQ8U5C2_9EUKA|nr:putative flagellar basal body protein [Paratrimastix pyriformis]
MQTAPVKPPLPTSKYAFSLVETAFSFLKAPENQTLLLKWGLSDFRLRKYSFDQPFLLHEADHPVGEFLLDLFNSPDVRRTFDVMRHDGSWTTLAEQPAAAAVELERLKATCTSLDLFDRLEQNGIVRDNGQIVKCFPQTTPDFDFSDRLQEVLGWIDSEQWSLFSPEERSELLFHLLSRLVFGGGLCQYEDCVYPYLTAARTLYRDLVCVQRGPPGGPPIQVRSLAFQIHAVHAGDSQPFPLFPHSLLCYRPRRDLPKAIVPPPPPATPSDATAPAQTAPVAASPSPPQLPFPLSTACSCTGAVRSFCYMVVDPMYRTVILAYFPYRPMF